MGNSFSINPFELLRNITQASTPQIVSAPTFVGLLSIENFLEDARPLLRPLLKFSQDPLIKGILLHINCNGGSFGTTQAVINEILKIKKTKPIIVIIENICHSCAYYLAAASDFIFALPCSELGSIGVIRTLRHHKDLKFNENNVSGKLETTVITAGDYKYPGVYVSLDEERKLSMQKNSQRIYQHIVTDIAQMRNLSVEDEKTWANGREFVGIEALELGLIDDLGGYTDALEKMKELLAERGIQIYGNLEISEAYFV